MTLGAPIASQFTHSGLNSLRELRSLVESHNENQFSFFLSPRGVAQLVVRLVWDQEVRGSSPRAPTIHSQKQKTSPQWDVFWYSTGTMHTPHSKHGWRKLIFLVTGGFILLGALVLVAAGTVQGILQYRHLQTTIPTTSQFTSKDLAAQAQQQVAQGNLTAAEQSLRDATKADSNLDNQTQLAVVEYGLKKYPEAEAAYQDLLDTSKDPAFVWNGLGNTYRDWSVNEIAKSAGHQQSAIDAYQKAIQADPKYVAAYSNLAQFYYELDQRADALKIARQGADATQNPQLSELVTRWSAP